MALLTVNDVTVLDGSTITMPKQGVWSADLIIDQPDGTGFDAGTAVTIKADGGVELKGTVAPDRSGSLLESVHVRVLGGKAGLAKVVKPRGYVQPHAFLRDVINGILGDAGESLSSTVDASITSKNLTAWSTIEQPASQAIGALLDLVTPGNAWRILSDGTFWTGAESWASSSPQFDLLDQDPTQGIYVLGVDTPAIVPGVTIDGIGKVNRLEHHIDDGKIRTIIWTESATEERGLRGAIASIVRQEIAGIDYYTLYDAKVVSQSADGATVDLQPGDARLPGLQRVPVRWGLPGIVAKFASGTFMRLGWDRGDPQRPYACLSQGGETVSDLELAGNTYKAVLDTLIADLSSWVTAVNTVLGSNCVNGATLSAYVAQSFNLGLFAANFQIPNAYKSQVVKHG